MRWNKLINVYVLRVWSNLVQIHKNIYVYNDYDTKPEMRLYNLRNHYISIRRRILTNTFPQTYNLYDIVKHYKRLNVSIIKDKRV